MLLCHYDSARMSPRLKEGGNGVARRRDGLLGPPFLPTGEHRTTSDPSVY
jgi:hypothetical protein